MKPAKLNRIAKSPLAAFALVALAWQFASTTASAQSAPFTPNYDESKDARSPSS